MPITKQRTLDYVNLEWGTYVERFNRLPKEERENRIKAMGFESLRDMLAHILGWWEEGMGVILAVAKGGEVARKKYDYDVFNAEAVAKYKNWGEQEFLAQFEKTRQKMVADFRGMEEAVFEHPRVRSWIRGILIHHAREHLVTVSRFITLDLLENEWAEYIPGFNRLDDEKKKDFLSKQGLGSFHDLVAHVIGWWEEGARIISGIIDSPAFTWETQDTDAFNIKLTRKYASWSDEDLFRHFENVRQEMISLTSDLPDDAFLNRDIEGWLRDDVIAHYDDHPIPR